MLQEAQNSQIDERTYRPFIAVKNGLKTTITTDGLVDLSKVTSLKVPAARYDYLIRCISFTENSDGIVHCTGSDFLLVAKGQTEIDINKTVLAKLDAELFEKEV